VVVNWYGTGKLPPPSTATVPIGSSTFVSGESSRGTDDGVVEAGTELVDGARVVEAAVVDGVVVDGALVASVDVSAPLASPPESLLHAARPTTARTVRTARERVARSMVRS
jgi:hypothetical protein